MSREGGGADPAFRADVLAGLSRPQKAVPARWLYDDAGSALFEEITQLPEYYPTRTERQILGSAAAELPLHVPPGTAVVEFGSGSSAKTPLVLGAIAPSAYVPIDISGPFLREAARQLRSLFPDLPVLPLEADFTRPVALPGEIGGAPRLGFFPGSTIGNLAPAAAVDLLRAMAGTLAAAPDGEGAAPLLLIGFDLVKSADVLQAAYDDAAGVTARFNLNLARRINRELDGDLPLDALRHRARWNAHSSRIEMHLEAVEPLAFTVAGHGFAMQAGETIHTENSYKFTPESGDFMLRAGGWEPLHRWTDTGAAFAVVLARAAQPAAAP
ncbi:L-histidine N(alpha)-methyltransferase [Erythrobacteraceae bacterium CFH 75059]|uniref:L-histidine N(alpha)-methyltransferase n=1 Tax=Qipengyuania thermophila TaxID=2509361 RepID=UPI0010229C71|nr:L-histidine N(alpha)-methyltransferase [Qipengyuania thermophila]TCD02243.1 L-histidine N(alpha)-methyltransferase [Erythrobacteraceae bacterium CFH 75059]